MATNNKEPKWEGRETFEWWWGGKPSPFDRFNININPDDEVPDYN